MTCWPTFDIMAIRCVEFGTDGIKFCGERVFGFRFGTEFYVEIAANELMFHLLNDVARYMSYCQLQHVVLEDEEQ